MMNIHVSKSLPNWRQKRHRRRINTPNLGRPLDPSRPYDINHVFGLPILVCSGVRPFSTSIVVVLSSFQLPSPTFPFLSRSSACSSFCISLPCSWHATFLYRCTLVSTFTFRLRVMLFICIISFSSVRFISRLG